MSVSPGPRHHTIRLHSPSFAVPSSRPPLFPVARPGVTRLSFKEFKEQQAQEPAEDYDIEETNARSLGPSIGELATSELAQLRATLAALTEQPKEGTSCSIKDRLCS